MCAEPPEAVIREAIALFGERRNTASAHSEPPGPETDEHAPPNDRPQTQSPREAPKPKGKRRQPAHPNPSRRLTPKRRRGGKPN
jgi:pyruvate/2-oxoglutarate dehydrogenase complex dihydrolipoamide acyltransferase (E2) component